MSLYLREDEICPYRDRCMYALDSKIGNVCQGAYKRSTTFVCDFVQNGVIQDGHVRNKYDQTGKMQVILE